MRASRQEPGTGKNAGMTPSAGAGSLFARQPTHKTVLHFMYFIAIFFEIKIDQTQQSS